MTASIPASPPPGAADHSLMRLQHIPALDGLRGIAILLVILHNSPHYSPATGLIYLVALIATVGWIGVQLFFVLSGFLITSNLLDTQGSGNYFSAFFGRRVLRIFPLYYAALFIGLVLLPMLFPQAQSVDRRDQIWLWTFLFNWAHPLGTPAYGFPHFWSLGVEEQFYLVWPFLLYRMAPGRLVKLCVAVMIGALLIRTAMRAYGLSPEMVYEFTVCRIDALATGALLAAALRVPRGVELIRGKARLWLPAGVAIALVGAVITRAYTRDAVVTQTLGHTMLSIFFACLILASLLGTGTLNGILQRMFSAAWLRSVGKYSYGMYVLHFPITLAMEKTLPQYHAWFGHVYSIPFIVSIALLTYCAAFISYHLMEKHFLRLKRYFVARPDPQARQNVVTHA